MPNGSWGMDPDGLHGAGGNISRLETDASSASKGFLDSVTEAGSAVHHPTVKGALDTYHGTWSKTANRLPLNVNAAGSQVQFTATTGVHTDLDANDALSAPLGEIQAGGSNLSRDINA